MWGPSALPLNTEGVEDSDGVVRSSGRRVNRHRVCCISFIVRHETGGRDVPDGGDLGRHSPGSSGIPRSRVPVADLLRCRDVSHHGARDLVGRCVGLRIRNIRVGPGCLSRDVHRHPGQCADGPRRGQQLCHGAQDGLLEWRGHGVLRCRVGPLRTRGGLPPLRKPEGLAGVRLWRLIGGPLPSCGRGDLYQER